MLRSEPVIKSVIILNAAVSKYLLRIYKNVFSLACAFFEVYGLIFSP